MAKGLFDKHELGIVCPAPDCRHENAKSVRWLRDHTQLTCGGCGRVIELKSEQFRAGLNKVDKSVDDLWKTLGKLGKRR